MTIFLTAPGRPLAIGNGQLALWHPLVTTPPVTTPPGGGGFAAGAAGHWDASSLAGMLDSSASPVVGWNLNTSSVLDLTGTQNLAAYSKTAQLPQSTARLNGVLGGLGLSTVTPPNELPASGQYLPVISPDQGFQLSGATFGAAGAWSWFLVWSRPNWRQGGSTAPIALMTVGSTPIVTLDSTPGVASNLRLFPSGANVVLSSTVTRRHTHSLILINTPGTGVSAWLDDTQVASAVANPLTTAGTMTLLHDTTSGGGAQCWFHEAGYWTSALASGSVTTLLAWLTRWTRGNRRGISLALIGQSNAVNGFSAGAWHLMAQGVAWYLGALAGNVAGALYQTLVGGLGLYPVVSPDPGAGLGGTFLINPGDGSSPSGWALDTASGAMGVACQSYFAGLSAADRADIAAIYWPWNETDSTRVYSEKATLYAAEQRAISLTRGFIGQSASVLPWLTWNALTFPYGNDPGMNMIREVEYDLIQLSGLNAAIALTNVIDVNPMGATINSDGTATGGDYSHVNTPDLPKLGIRGAALAAKAILASSGGDTISAIPSGVVSAGGPRISHVYRQSATQYVLTIIHDTGTDLIVPQQAANGVGFALMDGGSVASPGNRIFASACARVDATHLLVTLPSAPSNAASGCLFFYPYGGFRTGSGNAVTDNASTITPPAGWDIGNQLGSAWNVNYPVAATTYGLAISTSPA